MPDPNNSNHITRRESLKRIGAALTLPSQLSGEVVQSGLEALAGPSLSRVQRLFPPLLDDLTTTISGRSKVSERIEGMLLYACGDRVPLPFSKAMTQHWIGRCFPESKESPSTREVLDLAQETLDETERDIRSAACVAQEILSMPDVRDVYRTAKETRTQELDRTHSLLRECGEEMLTYPDLVPEDASIGSELRQLSRDIQWLDRSFSDLSLSERQGVLWGLKQRLKKIGFAFFNVAGDTARGVEVFLLPQKPRFFHAGENYKPSQATRIVIDGLMELGLDHETACSGANFCQDRSDYMFEFRPLATLRSQLDDTAYDSLEQMIEQRVFDRRYHPLVDDVNKALQHLRDQSADVFQVIESGTTSSSTRSSDRANQPDEDNDFEPSELQEWYSQLLTTPFRR